MHDFKSEVEKTLSSIFGPVSTTFDFSTMLSNRKLSSILTKTRPVNKLSIENGDFKGCRSLPVDDLNNDVDKSDIVTIQRNLSA